MLSVTEIVTNIDGIREQPIRTFPGATKPETPRCAGCHR